jgi:hypothetical protein
VAVTQWLDDIEELKLLLIVEALKRHNVLARIVKYLVKRVSDFKREYNGEQELHAVKGLIRMGNQRPNINQLARLLTF